MDIAAFGMVGPYFKIQFFIAAILFILPFPAYSLWNDIVARTNMGPF